MSKGRRYFNEPKTAAGGRTIFFPASIYHELMAQKGEHLEELQRLGQRHQLVFSDAPGRPLNRANLTRRFSVVCKKASIPTEGRSLYTLRRSHATLSLLAGVSLESLSERMGHVSAEFAQDEYVDVPPQMQLRAAGRLAERLLRNQLAPRGRDRDVTE